jgi:glycosyltransferase involved in cell wall biosynthesis
MIQISAVIITFNEELNITRCIESLKKVADEIIVVDSYSTDDTANVAASLGAKVISCKFDGYGTQKDFAQNQATYQWVLSLDADEVISPELEASLLVVKQGPTYGAYKVNILTSYCGKWIKHCGWYPQPKVRLWNRSKGVMSSDKVHEEWHLFDKYATLGHLKGDLLHYSYNTISDHMRKIEQYSEIKAHVDIDKGKTVSLIKLWLAPKFEFFIDFVIRKGFLDGYYGYIICRNSAFYTYVKYAKIRQYSKQRL